MLLRTDPFRQLDRLTQEALGARWQPATLPLDAYRKGDQFVVHVDLPGVDPSSIDLQIEKNVLSLTAQRQWTPDDQVKVVASERLQGTFRRQLFLGESLDADGIEARYDNGVLTVTVPVAEQAKPRKVDVALGGSTKPEAIEASASAA